jgi:hypothetical protein
VVVQKDLEFQASVGYIDCLKKKEKKRKKKDYKLSNDYKIVKPR